MDEIALPAYSEPGLCVVRTFQEYLKRTATLRKPGNDKLFVTSLRPHRPISRDTASKWVKKMLRLAGIDLSMFTAHSTRSASTSAALAANVPLETILKTAGWTKESTFRKFYNKPIVRTSSFADSILDMAN